MNCDRLPLPEARLRLLSQFARWHCLATDADDDTRIAIDSLCRRLIEGHLSPAEHAGLIDALDEILESLMAVRWEPTPPGTILPRFDETDD